MCAIKQNIEESRQFLLTGKKKNNSDWYERSNRVNSPGAREWEVPVPSKSLSLGMSLGRGNRMTEFRMEYLEIVIPEQKWEVLGFPRFY